MAIAVGPVETAARCRPVTGCHPSQTCDRTIDGKGVALYAFIPILRLAGPVHAAAPLGETTVMLAIARVAISLRTFDAPIA